MADELFFLKSGFGKGWLSNESSSKHALKAKSSSKPSPSLNPDKLRKLKTKQMLISHRKHFIYTHTRTKLSTPVEIYFEPFCMFDGEWEELHLREVYQSKAGVIGRRNIKNRAAKATWWANMTAAEIKQQLSTTDLWDKYFKFCVVQNPYFRAVNTFDFLNKALPNQPRWYYYRRRFFKQTNRLLFQHGISTSRRQRFKQWLKTETFVMDQAKYMIDDEMVMDGFIRYEHIAEDLKRISHQLDIPIAEEHLPDFSTPWLPNSYYKAYFDKEAIGMIEQLSKQEIALFDYQPPMH